MSRAPLSLLVTTPLQVAVSAAGVRSFRAEDESGGFGILPGHVDFLTVLDACVIGWRGDGRNWSYAAVRGGVLTVNSGRDIRVACREAALGDDLAGLEARVRLQREAEAQAASSARVAQARLHARAIRRILRHLSDGSRPGEAALVEVLE